MGPTSDCYDYSCRENLQIVHIVFFIHAKIVMGRKKEIKKKKGHGNADLVMSTTNRFKPQMKNKQYQIVTKCGNHSCQY